MRKIIFLLAVLFLAFFIGKTIPTLPPSIPIIAVVGIAICLATLIRTDFAIIVLIFSMLLSPELKIAEVPERAVVIRVDDILLAIVFFTWIAKMAINKQLVLLKHTPLNRPIAAYLFVNIIATILGSITGDITFLRSVFYILKFIEYFMLFFLIMNNIRSKEQIKIFIAILLITCAIVSFYGYVQMAEGRGMRRTGAPFEGGKPEPNTLGGYLIFLFAISAGLFLYSPHNSWKFSSGALACFTILPFLFTFSRASYLAFFSVYLSLIFLAKKHKTFLIILLLLMIPLLPILLPNSVIDRVKSTFVPGRYFEPLGQRIPLDESASQRVSSAKAILEIFKYRPILGYGITGVGTVDSQFPRVLGETGIVGLWIFIWLVLAIFRYSLFSLRNVDDDWSRGLIIGFLAGFVGLLVHSLTSNTFIIVRIMEPFWFMAAVVISLPKFKNEREKI